MIPGLSNIKLLIAIASLFILSSCSKYEFGPTFSLKSKTARLAGSWEVNEVNGKTLFDAYKENYLYDALDPENFDFSGTVEQGYTFEKEGVFKSEFTINVSIKYSSAYREEIVSEKLDLAIEGNWKWTDKKESVEVDISKVISSGTEIEKEDWHELGIDKKQVLDITRLTKKELWFIDKIGSEYACDKI